MYLVASAAESALSGDHAAVVDALVGLVGHLDAALLELVVELVGERREDRRCRPCPGRSGPAPRIFRPRGRRAASAASSGAGRRPRGTGRPAARPPNASGRERGEALGRASAGRAPRPSRGSAVTSARVARRRARAGSSSPAPLSALGSRQRRGAARTARGCARPARTRRCRGASAPACPLRRQRAANSAACPPCEWPAIRKRLPIRVSSWRAARDDVEHAAALGARRSGTGACPACRGPRSRCARPRSRPSASAFSSGMVVAGRAAPPSRDGAQRRRCPWSRAPS